MDSALSLTQIHEYVSTVKVYSNNKQPIAFLRPDLCGTNTLNYSLADSHTSGVTLEHEAGLSHRLEQWIPSSILIINVVAQTGAADTISSSPTAWHSR